MVVMLESQRDHPPAAFLIFSMLYPNSSPELFRSILSHSVLGGVAYGNSLSRVIKSHGDGLKAPSSFGITQREIEILNEYLIYHSQKHTALHLDIAISTVKSTMQKILFKLNLSSFSQLIPFLRAQHWCNLNTGEVIWF